MSRLRPRRFLLLASALFAAVLAGCGQGGDALSSQREALGGMLFRGSAPLTSVETTPSLAELFAPTAVQAAVAASSGLTAHDASPASAASAELSASANDFSLALAPGSTPVPASRSASAPPPASTVPLPSPASLELSAEQEPATPPDVPNPDPGIIPVRIEIPAIGVDAAIVPVGLLKDGQMEAPKEYDGTGWFEPGYRPGAHGNSVIAGHVDHYTGPAVFYDLRRLRPGDELIVTGESGERRTFLVERLERYVADVAPLEAIFGPADEARLNLITCAGTYNRKTKQRDERLVVFSARSENLIP